MITAILLYRKTSTRSRPLMQIRSAINIGASVFKVNLFYAKTLFGQYSLVKA